MSEGKISIKKAFPMIAIAWILSLVTTLAIAYFTPFVPIGTNQIGDSSVTSDKIADGAIITTTLADGSVSSAKIVDGSIIAQDMADGSIITVKVADGAITTAKIADGSITAGKVANSAVTTTKIADSAIVTVKLANESVTTEKIAEGNVTTTLLADSAVTSSKLADNAIITIKLADGAVTSAKILDGTITAADLANNSVTSIKIADGAVTTTKMADYAVTDLKLAAFAIPMWSRFAAGVIYITSTYWVNDTGISATITLNRNSDLLILYSAEAWMDASGDWIMIRALVNSTNAYPRGGDNPVLLSSANQPNEDNSACTTRVFYLTGVSAGTYIVQVQYYMWNGVTTGTIRTRTLNIIALPT